MAGISILRRLLMKQAMKESAPFQREGIMSISRSLSGNVDAKVKRWAESAKRQGQDLDKMSEQEIRYLIELNKPKAPKVYSNEEAYKILNRFANQNKKGEVIQGKFGRPFGETILDDIIRDINNMETIPSMKEMNKVIKREGKYKSLTDKDVNKIFKATEDRTAGRLDDIDPEDFAEGGRTGFQTGAVAFPEEEEEIQSGFAPGKLLKGLGKLAQFGITIGTGGVMNPKTIGKAILRDQVGKKVIRPVILKGLEKAHGGGGGGTSIGGGQQTSQGIAGGAISHSAAKEARGDMSGWGLAEGGRLGLSYLLAEDTNERVPFKMGRRAFLKLMGGVGAGIGALKTGALKLLGKEGATVAKEVITTPNVAGKPAWFDALVTKVINEGEDVTKQFAYKERMRVNTKPISETEEVTIYRDLDDGSVRVNYGSKLKIDDTKPYQKGNIGRASNDPDQVDLIVRQGEEVEPNLKTGKGGGKTKASFEASEAEPRAVGGPEDADIEFDAIREVDNVDDLMQDVSVLEEFATGKKLTGKKAAKAKKKREDYQRFTEDQVEQANYLEEKYGPAERYYGDPEDYASGGLARMLGE